MEKRGRWASEWSPRFERLEIWVLNTEYRLFGPQGPQVTKWRTHVGRLDEMSKCLGVAPGQAALRLFWADATVSIEGLDLGNWIYWVGKRAPSEQQMASFLVPNIEAAWRGETRTRTFDEAKELWFSEAAWKEDAPACPERGGQPTPGIFVRRCLPQEGEDWFDKEEAGEPRDWSRVEFPTRPARTSAEAFLANARSNRWTHADVQETPTEAAIGVLLDVDGADLRFLAQLPLSQPPPRNGDRGVDPGACIAILGGPKGISDPFKAVIRETFAAASTPLVEVCLGPQEQMAHACIAFLRIQEDAGLFRAAVVDLLRTGKEGYRVLLDKVEAAGRAAAASAADAAATDEDLAADGEAGVR